MTRCQVSNRMLFRGVFVSLVMIWGTSVAAAQNHPAMDGPIRSQDTSQYDVEMIRTAISLSPTVGSVPAMSFVHVSSSSGAGGSFTLGAEGYTVSRVSMHGFVLKWSQKGAVLSIDLPERIKPGPNRSEWLFKVEYRINNGLSFRTSTKGRFAVWNGAEPGSDDWYPTPMDQLDSYMTQLRVSVPKSWEVWVGDDTAKYHPVQMVDGFSKRPIFAGAVSFLAFDTRQSYRNDFDVPVLTSETNSVLPFLTDLKSEYESVQAYLSSIQFEVEEPVFVAALVDGIEEPVTIGNRLLTTPEYWVTDDPWLDQFRSIRSIVSGQILSRFDSVPPTDAWLSSAVSNWIGLQVMARTHGKDAEGMIYEKLRDAYLLETKTYRRPLVWDRWEYPSDLLDEHSSGKGLWVLRMLEERIGEESLTESIVRFLDKAAEGVADTETFRSTLEVISGENLSQFFDVWVYSAGHPVLTLSYTYVPSTESADVTIEQKQIGPLVPNAFEFDLAFQYSSLEGVNTSMTRVTKRKQTSKIQTSLIPRYVFPDAFASVLLDYATPLQQDDLVAQLRNAVGPVSKIRSLRHLTRTNPDPAVLLGLRVFLQSESEPAVLVSACKMLGEMAPSTSALSLLIEFSRHPNSRIRVAAIRALAKYSAAVTAFDTALAAANSDTDTRVLREAVSTIITLRPSMSWSLIQSALVTPSKGDIVARTALGLIKSGIAEDRDLFGVIRPLLDGKNAMSLRVEAFFAFARIDSEGQTVKSTVDKWLGADEIRLRKAALNAIVTYPGIKVDKSALQAQLLVETSPQIRRELSRLIK